MALDYVETSKKIIAAVGGADNNVSAKAGSNIRHAFRNNILFFPVDYFPKVYYTGWRMERTTSQ